MTYFDCIRLKNNEIHDSDPLDQIKEIVAYRVPKDAERAMFLVVNSEAATFTFKGADNVFGGKELNFNCPGGYYCMYVDINTMIHHSGDHEGCILIEYSGESCLGKLFVLEN